MREYEHFSKIKEKLSPALDELVAHGYIASWQIERASDGKSYKVVLHHGRKRLAQRSTAMGKGNGNRPDQLSLVPATEAQARKSAAVIETLTDEESALVEKLLEHGLHRDKARKNDTRRGKPPA